MGKKLITAITLVAGGTIAVLNSTILTPILPVIMDQMSVSATTVQWLASLFMLVNAVVIPMTAYIMGRFNVRALFAAAMVFLAAGSLLCMWAPTFGLLLVGRAVQAVASGILMPLIVTVLMLIYPVEKRGTVMGVFLFAVSVAPAIGPVLIGALADSLGWRLVFVAIAAIALLLLIAGTILIDKTTAGKPSTLDPRSVILSSLPLLCLLYGFSSISGGNPILAAVLILIGIIGLVFFVKRQLALEIPYLDIRVFTRRNYAIGTIMGALANAVLTVLTVSLPLFLQNVCLTSATVSGLAVAPIAAGAAIISFVAGKLHDKIGARITAIGGAFVMAIGSIGLLFLNASSSVILTAAFAACVGIGAMGANVPMNTWAINALPNELISHGNAVGSTVRQVASSLGTALAVTIMALGTSIAASAGSGSAVLVGSIAAFAFIALLAIATLILSLTCVSK